MFDLSIGLETHTVGWKNENLSVHEKIELTFGIDSMSLFLSSRSPCNSDYGNTKRQIS